jgi:hypothetical protein
MEITIARDFCVKMSPDFAPNTKTAVSPDLAQKEETYNLYGLCSEDRLQFFRDVSIPAFQTGVAYNLKTDDANHSKSPWNVMTCASFMK